MSTIFGFAAKNKNHDPKMNSEITSSNFGITKTCSPIKTHSGLLSESSLAIEEKTKTPPKTFLPIKKHINRYLLTTDFNVLFT